MNIHEMFYDENYISEEEWMFGIWKEMLLDLAQDWTEDEAYDLYMDGCSPQQAADHINQLRRIERE